MGQQSDPTARHLFTKRATIQILLAAVGVTLVYQSFEWFYGASVAGAVVLPRGSPVWGGVLLMSGSISCLLAVFSDRLGEDAVIAACLVSLFWTLGASILFLRSLSSTVQGVTLGVAACLQGLGIVNAVLKRRHQRLSRMRFGEADFEDGDADAVVLVSSAGRGGGAQRDYGALASFVDPIALHRVSGAATSSSAAAGFARPSPTMSASVVSPSPPRTPSPFGSAHNTPHRHSPHRSAAALNPGSTSFLTTTPVRQGHDMVEETPEDLRASYKTLIEKFDLQ